MHRAVGLFLLLWAVSVSGLVAQMWWSMSPLQRYYVRPQAEAEILVHVRVPSLNLSQPAAEPHVAVVLYTPPSGWRWYVQPASQVAAELRSVYPAPLLPGGVRMAVIAMFEALVLYGFVLGLARSIAAREHRVYSTPPRR